jgi:phosphatidylserine synthase
MKNKSMISVALDPPNIVSLVGLLSAVTAIYAAILGAFPLAIVAALWAVVFDWADGIVARNMKNRSDDQRTLGANLDSLIDIVSFGVFPGVFLLAYGGFGVWFLPGAFILVAVAAVRLSYFNVFGLVDSHTYQGLALDNNIIILAFFFLVERFFDRSVFSGILYAEFMIMAVFNVAPIRTPKFSGKWFYVLIILTLAFSIVYGLDL